MAAMLTPQRLLELNHQQARLLAEQGGRARTRRLLERAQRDLEQRLVQAESLSGPGADSFTATQLRVTLEQVRNVLRPLKSGMRSTLLDQGKAAADQQTDATLRYMRAAERQFRGVSQPLQLREAGLLDRVHAGTESSVLNRIANDPDHPGRPGVLDRYGDAVIQRFEERLQLRFVAKQSWAQVRAALVTESPFLQGAPAHWAERVVRTETMAASNRANWETMREADVQLGDMLKILAATFDSRTASDSVAVHGQIRRPAEAFESWYGLYQHPPNRPNDREVVVPHRMSWPLPPELKWRSDGEVASRWQAEGRKGSPPRRPKMTTVPLAKIGK